MKGFKELKATFLVIVILLSVFSHPFLVFAAEDDLVRLSLSATEIILGEDTEIKLGVNGTEAEVVSKIPVDVVLVMDVSGSMLSEINGGNSHEINEKYKKRLYQAREAAKAFVDVLVEDSNVPNRLSMVAFNHQAETLMPLTLMNNPQSEDAALDAINNLKGCGGTNYFLALEKARSILDSSDTPTNNKVIVFMSDGRPTVSHLSSVSIDDAECSGSYNIGRSNSVDGDSYRCYYNYDKSFIDQAEAYQGNLGAKEDSCTFTSTQDYDEDAAKLGANLATGQGYSLYLVGFGPNVDMSLYYDMLDADLNSPFVKVAPDGDDLKEIYKDISEEITNIVVSDVMVDFEIPENVDFVSGSSSYYGSNEEISFLHEGNILRWTLGKISRAENISLRFRLNPNLEGIYDMGENSFAEYINPELNTDQRFFPVEQLVVNAPNPVITEMRIMDEQCAYEIPRELPVEGDVCFRIKVTDDNLITESESDSFLQRMNMVFPDHGGNYQGRCGMDGSGSTGSDNTYYCEFISSIPLSSPGRLPVEFTVRDITSKQGEYVDYPEFTGNSCDLSLKAKAENQGEYTLDAVITDQDSNVIFSHNFIFTSTRPVLQEVTVPDIVSSGEYYLSMSASGNFASEGSRVNIFLNGKVNGEYVFSGTESYLNLPISDLTPNPDDICDIYSCVPGVEVCDGRDNDCDSKIDEFDLDSDGIEEEGGICGECSICETKSCDTGFPGICSEGVKECVKSPALSYDQNTYSCSSEDSFSSIHGVWDDVCEPIISPGEHGEIENCNPLTDPDGCCDGIDNDCDGMVDEGLGCSDNECVPGDTRPCECDCSETVVLLIRDDNHHNEDINDLDTIRSDLEELGVNVDFMREEEFSSSGFNLDDIKDYDLVWFSNPGFPPDDESSLLALKQYFEMGNPVVMQGDDMTQFRQNPELIEELTGYVNVNNGWDNDHTVYFIEPEGKPYSDLLQDLSGQEFQYDNDDIDISYELSSHDDYKTLAYGYCNKDSWSDVFSEYTPVPVISIRDKRDDGMGVMLVALLTFVEIEPEIYRKKFIAKSVEFLMNLAGKCDCEEADPPECGIAIQTCTEDGVWGLCEGVPLMLEEICCDGKDNDCDCPGDTNGDGKVCYTGDEGVDEGCNCDCIDGEERVCGPDVFYPGLCEPGKEICSGGVWGECEGAIFGTSHEYPNDEGRCFEGDCGTCDDGLDNDCDGTIDWDGYEFGDEIIPPDPDCPCPDMDMDGICDINDNCIEDANGPLLGTCVDYEQAEILNECIDDSECISGKCVLTQKDSDFDGIGDVCDCIPKEEICDNGLDDDCDGLVDENCECYPVGARQSCGLNSPVEHCVVECITSDGDGTEWGTSCMNVQDEDLGITFEMQSHEYFETCSDGLDNDCDGTADFTGTTLEDSTELPPDPDCSCNLFEDYDKLYQLSPDPVTSIVPGKFNADFSFRSVRVDFSIMRNPPLPVLELGDAKIRECRLYSDRNIFSEYFHDADLYVDKQFFSDNLNIHHSGSNYIEIDYKHPDDPLKTYALIDLAEEHDNKLDFKCTLELTTSLGKENCDTGEYPIIFSLETQSRKCEPRLCLIKSEMDRDIIQKTEIVDKINDVMNVAQSICSVIPTIGSVLQSTGVTVKLVGDVLRKIGIEPIGTGLFQFGENVIRKPGEFVMDKIWEGENGLGFGNFRIGEQGKFGFRWICDNLITCQQSKDLFTVWKAILGEEPVSDVEDSGFMGVMDYVFGDAITDHFNDLAGSGFESLSHSLTNDIFDGESINHLTAKIPHEENPLRSPAQPNPGTVSFASCGPGTRCFEQQYIEYAEGAAGEEAYNYDLGFELNSGISTDNLIYSTLTLCVPGMIRGVNNFRKIQCTYVDCLMTDQPVSACSSTRADVVCHEVVGSVTELIGVSRLLDSIQSLMTGLIQNWPDILIENGWRMFCDNLPSGSTGKLLFCEVPKATISVVETGQTLAAYTEAIINFFTDEESQQAFFGRDVCDEVFDEVDYINEMTTGCECYNGAHEFTLETPGFID